MAITRRGKNWLCGIVWLAAALRLPPLFANTFHADEALFATWARLIAGWQDPLLVSQQVDKPPLLFYLQALFYPLLGPVEWAARLPSFIASLLLIPLVAILAWRLYRDELTALVASLLVAMSPYAVQFSATAFIDPMFITLIVASLASMVQPKAKAAAGMMGPYRGSDRTAGLLFGLAVATKFQAWLFLPLVAAMALLMRWRPAEMKRWISGFLPILFALLLWEAFHAGGFRLWPAQYANFGGLRPVWSWDVWPRFQQLLHMARWLIAPSAYLVLLALFPLLGWRASRRWRGPDLVWILFLAGYFLAHWLVAVPLWDRYLLPAVPILALLLARSTAAFVRTLGTAPVRPPILTGRTSKSNDTRRLMGIRPALVYIIVALALLLQLPAGLAARQSEYPIGGRPSADHGAALVAGSLYNAPYGTVLYDHWYSWQWRYQLLNRRVHVSWFPHPEALVEDLLVFADEASARYVALPRTPAALPVKRAIAQAGFGLRTLPLPDESQIGLYRIMLQRDP